MKRKVVIALMTAVTLTMGNVGVVSADAVEETGVVADSEEFAPFIPVNETGIREGFTWVVDKEAWTETIEHKEEGHYETVVDEEAWTEEIPISAEQGHSERVEVVDKPAWTEEIEHPEEGHYEDVVVKEAWDEEVVHPAETHEEWVVDKEAVYGPDKWVVDKEAWDEVIHHEAEYETVHHEAEYKHHPAEYETVHHEEEGHYGTVATCYNCGFMWISSRN